MQLLHAFQAVERTAYAPDLIRKENDAEHSYMLAMLCWYLADAYGLSLSKERVLRYALVHDLVEVYAGDTYFLDLEAQKTKQEREEKARLRIAGEFPEFKDLDISIQRYEERADPEAEFVHAVDKLIPLVTNYLQRGHAWKQLNVDHEELYAQKRHKIGDHKEVRDLLEQFIEDMRPRLKDYFNF